MRHEPDTVSDLCRKPGGSAHLARQGRCDLLGTFTRDIPRAGMQLEATRKKVRIGMQLSGLSLGLASEGSFGVDPFAGVFPWNVELLIFIDDEHGLEVLGVAQGATNLSHLLTDNWAVASAYAKQAGFPAHHLVVRPEGDDDPRMRKGIATWAGLEAALAVSADGNRWRGILHPNSNAS